MSEKCYSNNRSRVNRIVWIAVLLGIVFSCAMTAQPTDDVDSILSETHSELMKALAAERAHVVTGNDELSYSHSIPSIIKRTADKLQSLEPEIIPSAAFAHFPPDVTTEAKIARLKEEFSTKDREQFKRLLYWTGQMGAAAARIA